MPRKQRGRGQGGREMGKYIQNITARDLIFQVKMNRKKFGGRAPPEPAGGAYALPRPRKRKRRRQGGREIGKYNQNITARDLIFQVKMNRKTFGDRAPPGPDGELKRSPDPGSEREREGGR